MSSLADYLAKNYLTADPPSERPKKKRKKNKDAAAGAATDGLIIADDDPPPLHTANDLNNDEDENSPYVIDTSRSSAEFRRMKKSNWKTVAGDSTTAAGQAEADAIIASAAAESAARREANEAEDAPTVEGGGADIIPDNDDDSSIPRMESGARAGLQTADQTAAMVAAQEKRRKAEAARYKTAAKEAGAAQETIYRDASGRIINVAMKRAEARRAAEEQRAKEEKAKESLLGDVQRQEKELRKQELQEARSMPLARTIEDESLNAELKSRDRWNDPAAQFLSSKKEKVSVTGRPLYRGAFAPNRYGIRPGHRWDGVDRSTGFEKEWFQARARKERIGALEYAWQMDE